ncbi:MAG: hypothetical protein U1E67_23350 [Hyphomicrobiales bacterium]
MTKAFRCLLVLAAFIAIAGQSGYADAAGCMQGAKSKKSTNPVKVKFVNKSGEYRGVFWLDYKGQMVNYANLNPGESYTVDTFVSHPWVFTDGPGNCIEMYYPAKGKNRYNITVKSSGSGQDGD